ncbi:MAG: hypothetical protein K8I82_15465 [Anaerolineae bacterium]|nr:hypothetical protein [Anaerolineae bacterium]
MVAVGVGEGINVAVEEGVKVKVTVVETVISGNGLSFGATALLPSSRYAKIPLREATKIIIPIMLNHFFTPSLMR